MENAVINITHPTPTHTHTQAVRSFRKINASDVIAMVGWFPYKA